MNKSLSNREMRMHGNARGHSRELYLYHKNWFDGMMKARQRAEAEYRKAHKLREPTDDEFEKSLRGKIDMSQYPNVAWDYPPEIYAHIRTPKMPKSMRNILGIKNDFDDEYEIQ